MPDASRPDVPSPDLPGSDAASLPAPQEPGSSPQYWMVFASPIGELLLIGNERGLSRIQFPGSRTRRKPADTWVQDKTVFKAASDQLAAWFAGELRVFDLTLDAHGTDFQCAVWNALRHIPFGETVSYAELALRIGKPSASRAVGAANGANPLPIVVPCHRVIGADGSLTGFAGGVETKRWLLAHEASVAGPTGRQQPMASDQLSLF